MESQKGDIRVVLVQTEQTLKEPHWKNHGHPPSTAPFKIIELLTMCDQHVLRNACLFQRRCQPITSQICKNLFWAAHHISLVSLFHRCLRSSRLIDALFENVGSGTAELFGWKGCVMLFCCCGATSPQHFQKKNVLNFVCVRSLSYALTELEPSSPFKKYICFVVERTESTMFLLVADTVHSSVWRDAHEFYEFWTNATDFAYYPTFGWWGWLDMYWLYPKSTGLRLLQRVFRHKGPSLQPQAASVQPNLRVCLCAYVSGNAAVR